MSESIDDIIRRTVKEQIDEALAPIRPLILRMLNADEIPLEPLVGPLEVAAMLGLDLSTPEAQVRARQHVYYLTRCGLPYVQTGRKSKRFNPAAVRRWINEGGLEKKSPLKKAS